MKALGVVIGLAGVITSGRVRRAVLSDLSPFDPTTSAVATALLFGVALLLSYLPARRAALVELQAAIRGD